MRQPALREACATAVELFYGLDPVPSFPFPPRRSWCNFAPPAPPDQNLPPREGDDPHGKAGDVPAVLIMVSEYPRPTAG